jgi:site-specific recombinase XerD
MSQVDPENARTVRRYLHFLREAEGLSEATVDHAARAIADYETFTGSKAFKRFKSEDAVRFRRALLANGGKRSAQLSSRATVHTKLMQVQKFFRWLAGQPGFKSRISYADVAFFSLSTRDRRIALERREKPTPSLQQIQRVIRSMPASTDIELRDRALVAGSLLTGARASALISLKLKHVRVDGLGIDQDAREVRTKFSKSFPTFFFPVGDDILQLFRTYVDHMRFNLLFGDEDPLFPRTKQGIGFSRGFETSGLERRHWQTADPIRRIFKRAFAAAQLPYYCPHSVRKTLTRLGQRICRTPEAMKAWSQNLGHDEVCTTLTSYGAVPRQRQAELIRTALASSSAGDDLTTLNEILNVLKGKGLA